VIAARRMAFDAATGQTPGDLADLVRRLGRPRVLVVGDAMLDQYISCEAERISQEVPVPLLRAGCCEERAGGAANVALALAYLGADVTLASVVGPDRAGSRLRRLLRRAGLTDEAVVVDPGRPTTRKRRYVATAPGGLPRQILRVDVESREPIPRAVEARLFDTIEARMANFDIILVSDYDKGVCTLTILQRLVERSRRDGRRVLVDPPRLADFARYRGASCLTPNRLEAGLASGLDVDGPERAFEAGEILRRQVDAEAILVTLDEQGMALVAADGRREHHSTRPREVRDTTGAGDIVLGVLGLCLACGVDYGTAAALGNVAGGIEVERWGVAPLRREDLLRELEAAGRND
jgi:D-beta-D-heptose 7-phosphate kinase / D-beta-D-heptose 1-phosphate adenosyltransferase